LTKQMVKERQDITGSNCLKGVSGKVIADEKGIKDSWKEYMEKLMNEENEWDHSVSTTMSLVGECFFWCRLTRVVPDNFHRAVKRLCVCQ